MPHHHDQQHQRDWHSIEAPKTPFVLLQVLQPCCLILRDLQRAVDGAQGDKASREVDEVRQPTKHAKVPEIFMPPMKTNDKVPHRNNGKCHVTAQLQNEAEDEDDAAGDDAPLGRLDAAVRRYIMVVGTANGARTHELNDEAEEVEDDEGGCNVPWETP